MTEKKYARVVDGAVLETVSLPATWDLNAVYHPDIAKGFIPCSTLAEQGWTYDGKTFAAPKPPKVAKGDLITYAANKRWQIEIGGITLNDVLVATDDRSKLMIMGARIKAAADPNYAEGWKAASGNFLMLDAATLIAISDAVQAHVSACFAAEAVVVAEITAGKITTTEQIDAYGWPGGAA